MPETQDKKEHAVAQSRLTDGLGALRLSVALSDADVRALTEWHAAIVAEERSTQNVVRRALMYAAFDVPSGMKIGELRETAVRLFGRQAVDAAIASLRPNVELTGRVKSPD